MTIKQMMYALPVVQKLMGLSLPIKKAHKLYSLAKVINESRIFFISEEKKIVEKFNGSIGAKGEVTFADTADQLKFADAYGELLDYEIPDIEAVELTFDDLGCVEFTPIELSLLEGVIIFVE